MIARSRRMLLAVLLLGTVASSGCNEVHQGSEPLTITGPGTERSKCDLSPGERFLVALGGNAGTGYLWEAVAPLPGQLAQVGDAYFDCDGDARPGCAGVTTFTFEAIAAGDGTLRFEYHRPWESGVPPIETFEVVIHVE